MQEEKPPFFKSWNRIYALVVAVLVLQLILYFLFTKQFE
jgi:hypothetical protein